MSADVLTSHRMSPRRFASDTLETVLDTERRLWYGLAVKLRDARLARKLSVTQLAIRAGVSTDVVYLLESGRRASTQAVIRIVSALGLRLDFSLTDPRRRYTKPSLSADPVHSAMGELEARQLRTHRYSVGMDEPYQHYQFAGRADVVAWDTDSRALLHIENRTRFPDFQEMAGAYNAKRAYLGEALAQRLGIGPWRSETHVIAALWSAEVLHALRLRSASFRALCPEGLHGFAAWWGGEALPAGSSSSLIVLDPQARGRQRTFIALEEAVAGARPRYRGYADAAAQLMAPAA